jgi:hypothetical protein
MQLESLHYVKDIDILTEAFFILFWRDIMSKLEKMSESDKIGDKRTIWIDAGLIAISLIILQDYISTGISDTPIFISVIIFSLALPLLVGSVFRAKVITETGYRDIEYYKKKFRITFLSGWIGTLCAFIGVDAAFWHLSWIAGLVFIIVSIFSFMIYDIAIPTNEKIERLQREEAEKERALE